jgi:large subunit ribosomal protein L10
MIDEIRTELSGAASILLTDLSGLDVDTVNELRSKLRAQGVRYRVAKNTLIKRAIADTEIAPMESLLVGPTALAWHNEEPATAAKIFKDFVKNNEKMTVKGGFIDGEAMEGESALQTLADIPSKDELRAQLLGLMKMVPGKFLALMQTPPRKAMALLLARKDKLEQEGGE